MRPAKPIAVDCAPRLSRRPGSWRTTAPPPREAAGHRRENSLVLPTGKDDQEVMDARASHGEEGDHRPAVAVFRSPLFNPSETFVRDHVAGLRRYRPVVCGLHRKGDWDVAAPVIVAGLRTRISLALLGRSGKLAEALAAERAQLIHAHFGTDGLIVLPVAARLAIPLVVTLHGFDVSRSAVAMARSGRLSWMRYALARRRLFGQAALFLAVSEAVRRRALALGVPADRLVTHYSGVDLDRFRPHGAAAAAPEVGLILHIGRLVEKKGTHLLLAAMARLASMRGDARLVVIGDGPLRARLEREVASLGLGGRVAFLGARPRSEVLGWMRRAWLLAAPSLTARDGDAEGLPTVLCEAAATGLPAVTSRHAGNPEAVLDGETGLLVPEGNAEALAAALAAMLADPARRMAMAAGARALAEERFDATRQTERLETRYDEVRGIDRDERRCA